MVVSQLATVVAAVVAAVEFVAAEVEIFVLLEILEVPLLLVLLLLNANDKGTSISTTPATHVAAL